MRESDEKIGFDSSRAELFEALGHPIRVKIIESLSKTPHSLSELKKRIGVESSGHLQFHLNKLNGLIETTSEGSYKLTDDGREALRIIGTMKKTNKMQKFQISYSFVVFIVLIFLSLCLLSYQERALSPRTSLGAPLEKLCPSWDTAIPLYVEPNQSVTLTYTVNYDWVYPSTVCRRTSILIEEYLAPENTFEVYEYDLGYYSFAIYDVSSYPYFLNRSYHTTIEVYSPEGKLLNKGEHEPPSIGGGLGWSIDEPGN
ncbi:MAG: winged helix-turn-helix domain-containing protein [Thermoproteota archaeon]